MKDATSSVNKRPGGFTLIATVMIVVLVAIAVIGLLSVVSTRTATTSITAKRAEARANAMVGLREALSQLQEHAGPDQRITATASILDADPETEEIEDVPNPHWIGVWSTLWDESGAEYIRRNDRRGGLLDRRTDQPMQSPEAKERRVLTWLVSGNEMADPRIESGDRLPVRPVTPIAEDDEDAVEVVGKGSALRKGTVRVYRIPIPDSQNRSEGRGPDTRQTVGHYAYWVGDENVKAKVNVANPYHDLRVAPENADAGAYSTLIATPTARFDHVWENGDIPEELN